MAAPAARTKKGEARRAAIMKAAAELFLERGFRATGLDDIGAAAGVSGPAIYQYFEGKQDLLASLVEDVATQWRSAVDEVLSDEAPPLATLERLIETAAELQLRNGDLRSVVNHEIRSLPPEVRRRIARIDRVTGAEWAHVISEVRPELTEEEARAAVIMVDGLIRSVSARHTSVDRAQLARLMKEMALGALLAINPDRSEAVPA